MISQATEMYEGGAYLLRVASLALAADNHRELGRSLRNAGMKLIEAAKTEKCPCQVAEPEGCQYCRGRRGCAVPT
jgi:hypothetical protein